jgi:hypothetical protein
MGTDTFLYLICTLIKRNSHHHLSPKQEIASESWCVSPELISIVEVFSAEGR